MTALTGAASNVSGVGRGWVRPSARPQLRHAAGCRQWILSLGMLLVDMEINHRVRAVYSGVLASLSNAGASSSRTRISPA